MSKALIAMSGGIDSSMAAYLTLKAGYECIGCTMKLYDSEYTADSRVCCTADDCEDARQVAFLLGFPFYVFNFREDFREQVIEPFIQAYRSAETPNPCITCNHRMKFGTLYERARVLGCDKIVTGHYARITEENGHFYLKKALDSTKDQSYVLYRLTEEQLSHTLFPLGESVKTELRKTAETLGFKNAAKPDSQDICFVPDGDYAGMISRYTGEKDIPGEFVLEDGTVIGKHKGLIHYTVGQRKGLGISWSEPLYVLRLEPSENRVVLGSDRALYSTEADVRDMNWINGLPENGTFSCKAKIRYRHAEQLVTVTVEGSDRIHLSFDEPQRAATPGQSAVLYDGDKVLGGGILYRK